MVTGDGEGGAGDDAEVPESFFGLPSGPIGKVCARTVHGWSVATGLCLLALPSARGLPLCWSCFAQFLPVFRLHCLHAAMSHTSCLPAASHSAPLTRRPVPVLVLCPPPHLIPPSPPPPPPPCQLRVHASGKMSLVIGEHRLLVTPTVPCLHAQVAVALCPEEGVAVLAGPVPDRMAVEIDLDAHLGAGRHVV